MHQKFTIGYSCRRNTNKNVNYTKSKKMIQKYKIIRIRKSQVLHWGHSKSTFAHICRFMTPPPPVRFWTPPPPPIQYVR